MQQYFESFPGVFPAQEQTVVKYWCSVLALYIHKCVSVGVGGQRGMRGGGRGGKKMKRRENEGRYSLRGYYRRGVREEVSEPCSFLFYDLFRGVSIKHINENLNSKHRLCTAWCIVINPQFHKSSKNTETQSQEKRIINKRLNTLINHREREEKKKDRIIIGLQGC